MIEQLYAFQINSKIVQTKIYNGVYEYLANLPINTELDGCELDELTRPKYNFILNVVNHFNKLIDSYIQDRLELTDKIKDFSFIETLFNELTRNTKLYNNSTFYNFLSDLINTSIVQDNHSAIKSLAKELSSVLKNMEEYVFYYMTKNDLEMFRNQDKFSKPDIIKDFNNYLLELKNPSEEKNLELINSVSSLTLHMTAEMTAELYVHKNPMPLIKESLIFEDILTRDYVDKVNEILTVLKAPYLDYVNDDNIWTAEKYYARYFFEVLEFLEILKPKSFNKYRTIIPKHFKNLKYGSIKKYSRDDANKDKVKQSIITKLKDIKVI